MAQIPILSEHFKLLGDKTRLAILALLKERELCVCEIVEAMKMSQPNVSQHLRKLKLSGLVNESRKGQWNYYSLNLHDKPHIEAILGFIPSQKELLDTLKPDCSK